MLVYFDIVRFAFLRFFSYPLEMVSQVLKRIFGLFFLALFWTLISGASNSPINLRQIFSYFLLVGGVSDLVMSHWGAFGSQLGTWIKNGQLNIYLMKPVNEYLTAYSVAIGRSGLRIILAIINILLGLYLSPPNNIWQILNFFFFFIIAFFVSFSWNLIEGVFYLHFTEAGGIRNSFQNIMRVFSGSLIPLYLFPSITQQIILNTPFAYMTYWPAITFSDQVISINSYFFGVFWAISFLFISLTLWKFSMRKYEAIGI